MFCLRSLFNDIVFNNDARNNILIVELLNNRLRQQFVVSACHFIQRDNHRFPLLHIMQLLIPECRSLHTQDGGLSVCGIAILVYCAGLGVRAARPTFSRAVPRSCAAPTPPWVEGEVSISSRTR